MKTIAIFICVLFISSFASAKLKYIDPNGVVPQMVKYLNEPDFQTSFQVGDRYIIQNTLCWITCKRFEYFYHLVKIGQDLVFNMREGTPERKKIVYRGMKDRWKKYKGNYSMIFLKRHFGARATVEFEFIKDDPDIKIERNGKEVSTRLIFGVVYNASGGGGKKYFGLLISKDFAGFAQVVAFKESGVPSTERFVKHTNRILLK